MWQKKKCSKTTLNMISPSPLGIPSPHTTSMVLKLVGNPEICFWIWHLIRARAVTNRIVFFSPKRPVFLDACATWSELPSNISTTDHHRSVDKVIEDFIAGLNTYLTWSL